MGSNRPSWGSSQALTNCDRSWEDSGSDSASHVRLSIDPPPSVTIRRTGRSRLVGSDTEEDGGSTPPAPTLLTLSSTNANPVVLLERLPRLWSGLDGPAHRSRAPALMNECAV